MPEQDEPFVLSVEECKDWVLTYMGLWVDEGPPFDLTSSSQLITGEFQFLPYRF